MAAKLIDGKALAQTIRHEIRDRVSERLALGRSAPGLAVVLVGDHGPSEVYVRNKQKACEQVGMRSWLIRLPGDVSQRQLLDEIERLNEDGNVNGILVQLPLPRHIDEDAVIDTIAPIKDVDAFHPENLGRLAIGSPRYLPCTPFGVQQMLERSGVPIAGQHVVILGRSNIVGKPLALMLMQKKSSAHPTGGDATVTVVHRQTRQLADVVRTADIIIAAVGSPRLVTADMVRPGAVVIDVGTNTVDGKLIGDVDFDAVSTVAGAISPVPGGVGPMTITMLLHNTLLAAQWQEAV